MLKVSTKSRLLDITSSRDPRGTLFEYDFSKFPFLPQRSFVIDCPEQGIARGGHAHRTCQQILICVCGRIEVECRIATECWTTILDGPQRALFVDAGVWSRQTYLKPNSKLLVFASEPFDPSSYVDQDAVS